VRTTSRSPATIAKIISVVAGLSETTRLGELPRTTVSPKSSIVGDAALGELDEHAANRNNHSSAITDRRARHRVTENTETCGIFFLKSATAGTAVMRSIKEKRRRCVFLGDLGGSVSS